MSSIEKFRIFKSKPTIEGAGVHLKRAFGYYETPLFDPFLLLDDFHSSRPEDYIAGFPWHPHRGIETVTYMITGMVEHRDSMGNRGVINSGDTQWMTAGSGIIHQEMPLEYKGFMQGFQLWVNLPSSHKMMKPRYRGLENNQIPQISIAEGVSVKVVAGQMNGTRGPVDDLVVDVEYLDVMVSPYKEFKYHARNGCKSFVYVFEGKGFLDSARKDLIDGEHLIVFQKSDILEIKAHEQGLRFLLVSGKPLGEPVAWRGPIVMNTQEELDLAFEEYRNGSFIRPQSYHERSHP